MRRLVGTVAVAVALFTSADYRAGAHSHFQYFYFRDVLLADVLKAPADFHDGLVRLEGIAHFEFEGTTLSLRSEARAAGNVNQAVWLDVGWPIDRDLKALNNTHVVVEERFDAALHGHMVQVVSARATGAVVARVVPTNENGGGM